MTDLRVSRESVEAVTQGADADARLGRESVEAINQGATADTRLGRESVEAIAQGATANARLGRQSIEILIVILPQTPDPVIGSVSIPAVAVSAGASPGVVVIQGTLPAAGVSAGALVESTLVQTVLPDAAVTTGSTASPSGADATVSVPSVEVSAGAAVEALSVVVQLPDATAGEASQFATVTPDPVASVASVDSPSLSSATTPDPVAALVVSPSAGASSATPVSVVVGSVAVPAAEPSAGSTVSPAAAAIVVATPVAVIPVHATTAPSSTAVVTSLPSAVPRQDSVVTPIFTAVFAFVPSAVAGTPTVVHPAAVRAATTFSSPTVLFDETLPIPVGVGLWYDASQIVGLADGDRVETWEDVGFYGRDLISSWIDNWLYDSEGIGGRPAVCRNPEEFFPYFESYDGTVFVTTDVIEIFMVAEGGIPEGEDVEGIGDGGFDVWAPGITGLSLFENPSFAISEYAYFTGPAGLVFMNTESYDPVTLEDYPYPLDSYLYYARRVPGDNYNEIHNLASTNEDWVFPDGGLTVDAGTVAISGVDYYRETCVAEIIVYFRPLATEERDQIIDYLDQKYQLFTFDMQPQSATWTGNAAATNAPSYDPPPDGGAAIEAMDGVRQNRTFYV